MLAVSQTIQRRVFPLGALLGVLVALGTATAVFRLGPKGCLIPAGVFLLVLPLVRPARHA